MDGRRPHALTSASLTRRQALQLAAGAAALGLTGCAPSARQATEEASQGSLVLISTQFQPVQEAEKMRTAVLAGFGRKVEFLGEELGPFEDRIRAEAQAGKGSVAVIGGQHGDMAGLAADDLLTDLSDLTQELTGRGFNPDYLELAKAGGDTPVYIPWAQASYLMAARKEAVGLLPSGADVNALTYEQLTAWGEQIAQQEGSRRLGFPAAQEGLIRRFFQGYAYPSFTGALNTKFASSDAERMWQWMRTAWAQANPQSTGYAFMQEPLQSGEVWVAWDHQARLIDALRGSPDDFVAFPAPTGPKGLGFIPVLTGLAIPKTAPDVDGAKDLIRYLTDPKQTATVARELGFFPRPPSSSCRRTSTPASGPRPTRSRPRAPARPRSPRCCRSACGTRPGPTTTCSAPPSPGSCCGAATSGRCWPARPRSCRRCSTRPRRRAGGRTR
jgi:multiple sugar transport system substrate-binding protein